MSEISQVMGDITNVVIRVEADVKEYFIDETRFGTRLSKEKKQFFSLYLIMCKLLITRIHAC